MIIILRPYTVEIKNVSSGTVTITNTPCTFTVIKSRRIGWVKYATRVAKDKISGDEDDRITVKWVLKSALVRVWPNFIKLSSQRRGFVKNGNELSSSMKARELSDQPRETNSSTKSFYYGHLLG
jgi:hypothetical protein